ncbi:hypothetical protein [Candidatus Chloroploca mongolica]|uniref:hypothetical protein n=1 Tax=Candidatus Chloroploca mongolica TaxID=2528176 RepID=UPI0010806677|nr:hypothetical protein [Candidatus Chloroploca mongolica]
MLAKTAAKLVVFASTRIVVRAATLTLGASPQEALTQFYAIIVAHNKDTLQRLWSGIEEEASSTRAFLATGSFCTRGKQLFYIKGKHVL